MTSVVLDTSVFIAQETGRPVRTDQLPAAVSVSVITLAELRLGVLASPTPQARAARLATLERAVALGPLDIDDVVASAWAQLRADLWTRGRRMPINDSWIAATAIAAGLPVASQDDDYDDVPGLAVLKV